MKKIVGIVAAASLVAGLAFADGPVANLSVTDFTGSATVEWGADLDAGQTGFKNSEAVKFVINLFDAGTKSTSSDNDVWAELVLKAGNTKDWTHKLFEYSDDGNPKTTEFTNAKDFGYVLSPTEGAGRGVSFRVDVAKLHFNDFYFGILSGDTTTGEYKFDGAIRGYDHWKGQGKWLVDVGPKGYSQGIALGYGNSNLGVDVDFRSNPDNKNQYTSDYAAAAEVQLKDSNEWVSGLFVDAGASINISKKRFTKDATGKAVENELTYKLLDTYTVNNAKTLGYSFNAGYKLAIDDKYWFKPSVGLTGTLISASGDVEVVPGTSISVKGTENNNRLVVGAMLGWGSAVDGNAGLYYFDSDVARKVCPGLSVVAWIPLPDVVKGTIDGESGSITTFDKVKAFIAPSFYTNGDLVEGLKAAFYSEIGILNGEAKTEGEENQKVYEGAKDKDDTFALALGAAVAYDIKLDEVTVTPQAGFRFVNTAFADNEIGNYYSLDNNNPAFFTDLGAQKKVADATSKRDGLYDAGFFNLKAGVNVNGLINNTDFFAVYQSANLLNGTDYGDDKFYNVKAGTFNVGCKISF